MCVDVYYNLNLVECTRDPLVLSSVPHPERLNGLTFRAGTYYITVQHWRHLLHFASKIAAAAAAVVRCCAGLII